MVTVLEQRPETVRSERARGSANEMARDFDAPWMMVLNCNVSVDRKTEVLWKTNKAL